MGKVELKLEIDADLLARARAAGAEPQAMLEAALRALPEERRPLGLVESARRKAADPKGSARRAQAWVDDNRDAIEDFNRQIAERGRFSDSVPRRW